MKQKQKPIRLFFPIERVNDEARTIEAYAFVNEIVDGEGGVRLKRSAMEAATPDYLKWANVRRMHQPDAVGVAHSVTWDATGARMTLEVVDDDAWQKVKRGVYKGLSVGVAATLMRGKDVEACKWYETSLVDRPKDPDAMFCAVRSDDAGDDGEFDCEVDADPAADPPDDSPDDTPDFASAISAKAQPDDWGEAVDALYSVLCQLADGDDDDREPAMRESCRQFENHVVGLLSTGNAAQRAAKGSATRLDGAPTENRLLLMRAEAAEADLAVARAELAAAKGRVKQLAEMPAAKPPPVRYYQGVERTFLTADRPDATQSALLAEFKRLQAEIPARPETERIQGVARMQVIRMELAKQGVDFTV